MVGPVYLTKAGREALETELQRLRSLWTEGLTRFGGPFLAGATFTAVDAFFAPVAFRLQTYGLRLDTAPDFFFFQAEDGIRDSPE